MLKEVGNVGCRRRSFGCDVRRCFLRLIGGGGLFDVLVVDDIEDEASVEGDG